MLKFKKILNNLSLLKIKKFKIDIRVLKKLTNVLVFFNLFIFCHQGIASDRDTQFWMQTILTSPVITKDLPIFFYLEYQPRHSNDLSRNDVSLLRPGLFYKLNSKIILAVGYLSLRGYSFDELERRTWQQVQYFESLNSFDFQVRVRLEQRYRQNSLVTNTDDSQVLSRLRLMLRVQSKKQIYGFKPFFTDEILIGLNSVDSDGYAKINSGYDQNRVFLGVNRLINTSLSLDFGYLHNNVLKGDGSTFLIHGGFANLVLKL